MDSSACGLLPVTGTVATGTAVAGGGTNEDRSWGSTSSKAGMVATVAAATGGGIDGCQA